MRLADVHAVVTGGGTGIGAAIARALAGEGARLTLLGRRLEPLRAVADRLPDAQAMVADVTDPASISQAFALARAAHGPVAILVNNAGAAPTAPFGRTDESLWRAAMAVNLDGPYHCIRAALDDLRGAPAGRIVNVASTAGLKGYAYASAYAAAKHGLIGLTRALAIEYARSALTVNAVCPGFADTPLVEAASEAIAARGGGAVEAARAALASFNPQGRLIEPAEVASAVLWLCQPEQSSITGQALVIAGGEIM